jgi:bacterioferritin
MPIGKRDEEPLRQLNAVLRGEFTAVNQYFLHILALRSWGDVEAARELEPVNNADFPNAMRIVDHLLALGALPELCAADEAFARHLPVIGDSYPRMFAADLELERQLIETFEAARAAVEGWGDPVARQLVADAVSRRRPHMAWLESQLRSGAAASNGEPKAPFGEATQPLNALLAHLIVALEQALVHAFVAWHARESELADAFWTVSYDAMLHGKSIVDLFGAAKTAPSFAGAASFDDLERPSVAGDIADALALERAVASRCSHRAQTAADALGNGKAGAVCRTLAAYFDGIAGWLGGSVRPAAEFPGTLRSFERLRATYLG